MQRLIIHDKQFSVSIRKLLWNRDFSRCNQVQMFRSFQKKQHSLHCGIVRIRSSADLLTLYSLLLLTPGWRIILMIKSPRSTAQIRYIYVYKFGVCLPQFSSIPYLDIMVWKGLQLGDESIYPTNVPTQKAII